MKKADASDKNTVVRILTSSFPENKSVQFIIGNHRKQTKKISRLMEYAFDICHLFGDIYLSEDRNACLLFTIPERKITNLKSAWYDAKLIFSCIGLCNISKVLKREAAIKKLHPPKPFYYLWFIGVRQEEQGKNIGTALLLDFLEKARSDHHPVYLETSIERNLPWYQKYGFTIYCDVDFGYTLYFLRNE